MPYNYNDTSVSNLIASTHFPVELSAQGPQPPNPQTLSLVCAKCYNAWPCQTILDYRAYVQATGIPPTANPSPLQANFQGPGKLIPPRIA